MTDTVKQLNAGGEKTRSERPEWIDIARGNRLRALPDPDRAYQSLCAVDGRKK